MFTNPRQPTSGPTREHFNPGPLLTLPHTPYTVGVDMYLVCHTEARQLEALAALVSAMRNGRVNISSLRAAAARVDHLMATYVRPPPPRSTTLQIIGSKEHRDIITSILRSQLR